MNATTFYIITLLSVLSTINASSDPNDPYCSDDPSQHLPHLSDCTRFYRCISGLKVWFDCPTGLHFNPVIQVCDWPNSAGCGAVTPPVTPTVTPPVTPTVTPPVTPTVTPPVTTPTVTPPVTTPTPNPTVCYEDQSQHVPHPTDCTMFYRCVNWQKFWFTCPYPLHFNRYLWNCDWPQSAGCSTDPNPSTPTPTPTQTPTPPTPTNPTPTSPTPTPPTPTPPTPTVPTTPTTQPPSSADCPAGIDMNFHPNPYNCYMYFQCIDGIRNDYTCPPGYYFNVPHRNCEWNEGQCPQ